MRLPSRAMTRLAGAALRFRYLILITATALGGWWWLTYLLGKLQEDYYISVYGGYALLGWLPTYHDGALHLYAAHPQIQVGPLPLGFIGLTDHLLPGFETGRMVIAAVILGMGLVTVRAIENAALSMGTQPRRAHLTTLLAGPLVVVAFALVGYYSHVEDAAVVMLTTMAVAAVAARRPWWLPALLLGAGVACKPWAVVTFPLLLVLDRDRVKAAGLAVAVGAAAWLPFILAAPDTVSALGSIENAVHTRSALRVFFDAHTMAPAGIRALEMVLGLLFAALVVLRGRWQAVILAGFAGRLLLEPRWFIYYSVSALVGALLWDLSQRRRVPVWTLWALVAEFAVQHWAPDTVGGFVNVAFALSVLFGLVLSARTRSDVGGGEVLPEVPARAGTGQPDPGPREWRARVEAGGQQGRALVEVDVPESVMDEAERLPGQVEPAGRGD